MGLPFASAAAASGLLLLVGCGQPRPTPAGIYVLDDAFATKVVSGVTRSIRPTALRDVLAGKTDTDAMVGRVELAADQRALLVQDLGALGALRIAGRYELLRDGTDALTGPVVRITGDGVTCDLHWMEGNGLLAEALQSDGKTVLVVFSRGDQVEAPRAPK